MTRLSLLLLVACASRQAPAPPIDRPDPGVEPAPITQPASADLDLLLARLSSRHPTDDCALLTAGLSDPRTALREAVDAPQAPPWAAIIAGRCLTRGWAAEEEATLTTWLTDPDYAGMARVVLRELPTLTDEALVLRLGAAALGGPEKELAADVLRADPRTAVQGLVGP